MAKVRKALAAAVAAAAGTIVTAVQSGGITGVEWGLVVGAVVVAGLGVWAVPNAKA